MSWRGSLFMRQNKSGYSDLIQRDNVSVIKIDCGAEQGKSISLILGLTMKLKR